jgi:hypothetical protein
MQSTCNQHAISMRTLVAESSSALAYSREGKGTRRTKGPAPSGRWASTAEAIMLKGSAARNVRRSTVPSSQRTRT